MKSMRTIKSRVERFASWGVCSLVIVWLGLTFVVEFHHVWPSNREQWLDRLFSWAMHLFLV